MRVGCLIIATFSGFTCFEKHIVSRLASPGSTTLRKLVGGERVTSAVTGWGLGTNVDLEDRRKRHPEGSDELLLSGQDLEIWNPEAIRGALESWSGKDKDQLDNWGHQLAERNNPSGSKTQNLDTSGKEPGATDSTSAGCTEQECGGALDNATRTSSPVTTARTGGGTNPNHSARRKGAGVGYSSSMNNGAPCGACKFLRRKCVRGCIFAPYFSAEQGASKFAAVHKVFGASNVAKLLVHIPTPHRSDAVLTISYEAQARLSDPVYGCVATIFALQQQVSSLQAELAMVQAQLADRQAHLQQTHHQQRIVFNQPPPEYMQQHHLVDQAHVSSSPGLSMGMPGRSSAADTYSNSRVKEEVGYRLQGMQQAAHHYFGMPSSSMEPTSAAQSLLSSLQKTRSVSMEDQPDEGELQALASLLRRK
uniref:LOB domain-containing protein n=1 Tax=Physcomitrium patens TaxID=3218 RepID=A0A2K1KMU8_PHYPA|nr:hypothetical protein PHYPA_005984 [Physcomitrium patens]